MNREYAEPSTPSPPRIPPTEPAPSTSKSLMTIAMKPGQESIESFLAVNEERATEGFGAPEPRLCHCGNEMFCDVHCPDCGADDADCVCCFICADDPSRPVGGKLRPKSECGCCQECQNVKYFCECDSEAELIETWWMTASAASVSDGHSAS